MVALIEGIRIALAAIWSQKLRSALTLTCVIIAILSIIAVVSVLDGMNAYVRDEIAEAGTNVFTVCRVDGLKVFTDFEYYLKSKSNPKISLADAHALKEEMTLASYCDPGLDLTVPIEAVDSGRAIKNAETRGRGSEYPGVEEWDVALGSHFNSGDVDERRAVAVLGSEVADQLFPARDPVGRTVRIADRHYEVVGVFKKRSDVLGESRNLFVAVPITALLSQFGQFRSINVQIKARTLSDFDAAIEEARKVMRVRHGLTPGREDNFNIQTAEQFLTFWEKISQGIFASLIGIVSITLVVGGIIIMNVMLVSVTERTREVGIRKALGARRGAILFQFLVESITLTTSGGVVGIVLGFTVAFLVAAFSPLPYAVKPWSIVAALIIVFAVGLFFGIYPASRAARLQPVEALRHE